MKLGESKTKSRAAKGKTKKAAQTTNAVGKTKKIPSEREFQKICWRPNYDQWKSLEGDASDLLLKSVKNKWPHPGAKPPYQSVRLIRSHNDKEYVSIRDQIFVEGISSFTRQEKRSAIVSFFEEWLDCVPPQLLLSSNIVLSENRHPFKWNSEIQAVCLDFIKRKKDFSIEVMGPQFIRPWFYLWLFYADNKLFFRMRFPNSAPWQMGVESFVEFVSKCISHLPQLDWARCNAGLIGDDTSPFHSNKWLDEPRWDLEQDQSVVQSEKLPAPGWLTYVGPALVQQLGGIAEIKTKSNASWTVSELKNCLLVRSSTAPSLAEKIIPLTSLQNLARLFKPVSQFEVTYSLRERFEGNQDAAKKWVNRFLP